MLLQPWLPSTSTFACNDRDLWLSAFQFLTSPSPKDFKRRFEHCCACLIQCAVNHENSIYYFVGHINININFAVELFKLLNNIDIKILFPAYQAVVRVYKSSGRGYYPHLSEQHSLNKKRVTRVKMASMVDVETSGTSIEPLF